MPAVNLLHIMKISVTAQIWVIGRMATMALNSHGSAKKESKQKSLWGHDAADFSP